MNHEQAGQASGFSRVVPLCQDILGGVASICGCAIKVLHVVSLHRLSTELLLLGLGALLTFLTAVYQATHTCSVTHLEVLHLGPNCCDNANDLMPASQHEESSKMLAFYVPYEPHPTVQDRLRHQHTGHFPQMVP